MSILLLVWQNTARGPHSPYRDEGHWPHYISAETETRTDSTATHRGLRWPECMGVCDGGDTVCLCVSFSHASNDGGAGGAGRAAHTETKYTK